MRQFLLSVILGQMILGLLVAADLSTPLEKKNFEALTSYREMMQFLRELDRASPQMELKIIGTSVEGRKIPALFLTNDERFGQQRGHKPVVLIDCQQHGNEPSGKEAALMVVRDLVTTYSSLLARLDVILVPQVNPDGAEAGTRRNAHKMDLNRNHVILSEPESRALHHLFLDWMPEVTLDVHEYNAIKKDWVEHGIVKDAEEMMGTVTNLNIDSTLRELGLKVFIPEIGAKVRQAGFSFHRYIVGSPFNNRRIRYSTTNINDGRQSMGIYNTLSFILEGKRYGDLTTELKRRTLGQRAALLAFLETVGQHAEEVLRTVHGARQRLQDFTRQSPFVHIQMDYYADENQPVLPFPVFNLYSWQHEMHDLDRFYPVVRVKKSVRRPWGYLIPGHETRLLNLLQLHRIRLFRVAIRNEVSAEVFHIWHITPTTEEDKPALLVDGEFRTRTISLSPRDIIVPLNQPAANLLPLILEPQSTYSIAQKRNGRKYRFADFLREGQDYPIIRLLAVPSVPLHPLKEHSGGEER